MKKQFNFKRVIAITLVVANVFASTGFSVLANSVANIVYDSAMNEKELKNYYYLYQEEKYRYEEQTRYYAEYNAEDNISDELKEKVKNRLDEALEQEGEVEETTSINDATLEEKNDEETNDENSLEDNDNIEEKEDEEEPEDDKTETSEEVVGENSEEESTTSAEETSIDETKEESEEESTTSTQETSEEETTEEVKEESTTATEESSETTVETTTISVETSTISETDIVEEEKVASESEVVVEEEKVATDSEVEHVEVATESEVENIATDSEAEVATDSEVEKATSSELEELVATKSIVVIATVPVVKWEIAKIYLTTYSEIDLAKEEGKDSDDYIKNKLAKAAKVLVKNNLGESKLLTIRIKWKLQKKIVIATRAEARTMPFKKSKWKKDFGVGKVNATTEIVKATSDKITVVDNLKEELQAAHGDEALVIIKVTTASILNDNFKVKTSVVELDENKVEEIKTQDETEAKVEAEETKETATETDTVAEIEIVEPTVAGFANSDVATDSDAEPESVEDTIEESSDVADVDDNAETEDNAENEEYAETNENVELDDNADTVVLDEATASEADSIATVSDAENIDDSSLYKDAAAGTTGTDEEGIKLDGNYDLSEMSVYTPDMEDLVNQVLNKLNGTDTEEVIEEEIIDDEINDDEDGGVLQSITNFFGNLFSNDSDEELEESEETEETATENNEEEDIVLEELKEINLSKLDNAKLDLKGAANEVELGELPLPEVEINKFDLFGSGYNEGHGSPTSTNRHPICGLEESTDGSTCTGHTIDGTTFYHDKLSGTNTSYRGIEVRLPDLAKKDASTVSVTTDMAVVIFKDAGKDNYTLNSSIKVEDGVNFYICTNGVDIVFASYSRIYGNGNIYLCNCMEDDASVSNRNVSHITTENDFTVYDRYGQKWPATMSRPNEQREDPLFSGQSVYIYGTDTANRCNIMFENIKIRGNFRNTIALEQMEDPTIVKNWSPYHGYGSLVDAPRRAP